MQREIVVKSRSLGGSSDLTLLARLRPGFAESLESITYKTRAKRTLEAFHGARASSHEYATARLLTDAVERVGVIHSVRVAVFEPQDEVLLAVSFDGSWESYLRVLWDKVGTLLDIIFCNTVDYVTSYDHSYEEWAAWARRVQVETGFFYGPPDATARDVLYHRRLERMHERGQGTALNDLRATGPSADEVVQRLVRARPMERDGQPVPDEPPYRWGASAPQASERMLRERMRTGLRSLAALYQLSDLYRPGTQDGTTLRLAAQDLLTEFLELRDLKEWKEEGIGAEPGPGEPRVPGRFHRQITWLLPPNEPPRAPRPAEPAPDQLARAELGEIQGGILQPYEDITHGLVVLLALHSREAAHAFMAWAAQNLTQASDPHQAVPGRVFRNLGLTPAGLRACGMDEDTLELLPEEFRQGMAMRAPQIGDVRNNHPRRWRLPRAWVPPGAPQPPEAFTVDLDGVHAALLLRCKARTQQELDALDLTDPNHPLQAAFADIPKLHRDLQVLAVQDLVRRYKTVDDLARPGQQVQRIQEHFGYVDGNGQPDVAPATPRFDANMAHLGEFVHGYPNAADFQALQADDPAAPPPQRERLAWLRNGSFLVLRKYRQYAAQLERAVAATAARLAPPGAPGEKEAQELVYAKLMGRSRDGAPLVDGKGWNNFHYRNDPAGQACPLHAHIRLAHPRLPSGDMARPPRLMRRSMSYGPVHAPGVDDDDEDRGLVFMAFNASIGEQYEVVQRWLSGGNSTGGSSGQGCPIVGVPENGLARHYRFEHKPAKTLPDDDARHVLSVELEQPGFLFDEPKPVTRLEWGLYLFTPSKAVLARLAGLALQQRIPVPWQLARGRAMLAELRRIEHAQGAEAARQAWKAAVEDSWAIDRHDSASLWAAIREDHGGLLRTPYGTLAASRAFLHEVQLDLQQRYSVSGQMERMKRSFGPILLGMDAGPEYDQVSRGINEAIGALSATAADRQSAFRLAFQGVRERIDTIVARARDKAVSPRFEASFEARELVDEALAVLCEHWVGLRDGLFLRRGGADLEWEQRDPPLPLYPGHFTAPSRYMFQPHPGAMATELGEGYGVALRSAVRAFVQHWRDRGQQPTTPSGSVAPISEVAFAHPLGQRDGTNDAEKDDFVARTLIGVLMGFIPTVMGAVLNVLQEWQREGTVGEVRLRMGQSLDDGGPQDWQRAHDTLSDGLRRAARMRPMPQLGWRTVRQAHRLGSGPHAVDLVPGDVVVLAIVSGTQQSLEDGRDDGRLMFGGVRWAPSGPSPTHACPGHGAGIEAMLGILAALVSRKELLRNGVGRLNFVLEDDAAAPAPATGQQGAQNWGLQKSLVLEALADAKEAQRKQRLAALPNKQRAGLVLCWGDSWLDNSFFIFDRGMDLRDCLERFGYDVPRKYSDWGDWKFAETMAKSDAKGFGRFVRDEIQSYGGDAVGIVLSGGGNDAVDSTLAAMLNPKGSPLGPFKTQPFDDFMQKLEQWYLRMLRGLKRALVDAGIDLPVLLHGYDHPLPSHIGDGLPSWMYTPFRNAGYQLNMPADAKLAADAMAVLIDRFNAILKDIAGRAEFKDYVRHVDLTGTLADNWQRPIEAWLDGLHPRNDGFALLAGKLDAVLQQPYP